MLTTNLSLHLSRAGQIADILPMPDFRERFADQGEPGNREFSNVREGLIVGE